MMFLAVILVVALMIPIIAILVDSPLGRSVARRLEGRTEEAAGGGGGGNLVDLQRKVDVLEGEVEELTRSLSATREELQFMQRLLEKPKRQPNA
jgi:nitrogen fixation/metabolism regulation signal transduction histidine kinase